ncbi:MAG: flagellar basal body P-ring protein FlgI [Deltaproteobacteria bacterium]|nr:flagellar basal body P-ring protein FlgI [Deltaproteobacteria bacterium]
MKRTAIAVVLLLAAMPAGAARIEELCDVRGVRPNQLIGYGLVVGLAGTGDTGQARFTVQSTAAMLRRLGATIDPASIQTKNAAAVMVTATLPAMSNPGTRIDVTVSSMGNARSLAGGTLLQVPLYGADRRVYAVAQGPLLIGGFSARGSSGSSVTQNHMTVGRVPEGAIVERRVAQQAEPEGELVLQLRSPSFVTAQRIVEAIDAAIGEHSATAVDVSTVRVRAPEAFRRNRVGLVASLQVLEVEPDAPARVVIDERTGTVVLGSGVRISEVAIAQGGLTVQIAEQPAVSQPAPFGRGDTTVVPQTDINAQAAAGSVHHVATTASLADVVAALNALGAKPRDMVAIFQALRSAGALRAEVEVQ